MKQIRRQMPLLRQQLANRQQQMSLAVAGGTVQRGLGMGFSSRARFSDGNDLLERGTRARFSDDVSELALADQAAMTSLEPKALTTRPRPHSMPADHFVVMEHASNL